MPDFDVDRIVAEIENVVREEVDELATLIVKPFVRRMPRLTGHARRNVQLDVGTPNLQELPGVDFSGEPTVTNALTKLQLRGRDNGFRPVFITNNVPYMLPLADGRSKQAAKGWVEEIIRNAIQKRSTAVVSKLQSSLDAGDFSGEDFT